jgi:DDE superfamily endonuclease
LSREWCIPPDQSAAFVAQMEDLLDLYTRPLDPARPLVCFDETSKQLVGEVRTPLPLVPGHPLCYDTEYERHGTANLFLFTAPLLGWRGAAVTEHRTRVDFAHAIRELVDVHFPTAERIVLVLDNLNTHEPASLYQAFAPAEAKRLWDKLEVHPTPKHGSWLNIAEIEFSVLGRQCLDRRIPDQATLATEVAAWVADRNAEGAAVDWRFTTADARIKLKHLYPVPQPDKGN